MIPSEYDLKNYAVYSFEHIDDEIYCQSPESAFEQEIGCRLYNGKNRLYVAMGIIHQMLVDGGWEGDGDIGVWWIPPFMLKSYGASLPAFHVKQINNGTSYLAIPNEVILPERSGLHLCSA